MQLRERDCIRKIKSHFKKHQYTVSKSKSGDMVIEMLTQLIRLVLLGLTNCIRVTHKQDKSPFSTISFQKKLKTPPALTMSENFSRNLVPLIVLMSNR